MDKQILELTITKQMFLNWFFDYGQDQENQKLRIDLANNIISQLCKSGRGTISVKELFDNCNKGSIRLYFTCQHQMFVNYDWDTELQDLNKQYTIQLI